MFHAAMDIGNTPEGEDIKLTPAVIDEYANRLLGGPTVHKPLTAQQQQIVRQTVIRVLGCSSEGVYLGKIQKEKDYQAIIAMNNALVIKGEDIKGDVLHSGASDTHTKSLQDYAKMGFHVTPLILDDLKEVLTRRRGNAKGYAFLMEHQADGVATPIGYQLGFAAVPSSTVYTFPSLDEESLPDLQGYRQDLEGTWIIWRTGIIRTIDSVRDRFEQIGIPIHSNLEGQVLQRLGYGQATKVVDAEAAEVLEKKYVQCNIGEVILPGQHTHILARNEASWGSNSEVFRKLDYPRTYFDHVDAADGSRIIEICWRLFKATPQEMLQRLSDPKSALQAKGWDMEKLKKAGRVLAGWIQGRYQG
jgi:hypothetical protein